MPRGNSKSNQKTAVWIVAVALILVVGIPMVVVAYNNYAAPFWHLPPLNLFPASTTQPPTGGDYVNVERKIDVTLMDVFAGAGLQSKTVKVFDANTGALLETLTTGTGGAVTTTRVYMSGMKLSFFTDDGNAHYWIPITVPQMLKSTAEGTTANHNIVIDGFSADTFTDLASVGGAAVNDGGNYNFTASGATGTISYSWAGVTDNTAMVGTGFSDAANGFTEVTGRDLSYNLDYHNMLFVVVSGNAWSKVNLQNMDGSYVVGSTKVFYKQLNDMDFVKYKVGTSYVHQGQGAVAIPFDATGIADTVTIQCYIFAYANAAYAASHSAVGATATDYGPLAVQLMETTIAGIV